MDIKNNYKQPMTLDQQQKCIELLKQFGECIPEIKKQVESFKYVNLIDMLKALLYEINLFADNENINFNKPDDYIINFNNNAQSLICFLVNLITNYQTDLISEIINFKKLTDLYQLEDTTFIKWSQQFNDNCLLYFNQYKSFIEQTEETTSNINIILNDIKIILEMAKTPKPFDNISRIDKKDELMFINTKCFDTQSKIGDFIDKLITQDSFYISQLMYNCNPAAFGNGLITSIGAGPENKSTTENLYKFYNQIKGLRAKNTSYCSEISFLLLKYIDINNIGNEIREHLFNLQSYFTYIEDTIITTIKPTSKYIIPNAIDILFLNFINEHLIIDFQIDTKFNMTIEIVFQTMISYYINNWEQSEKTSNIIVLIEQNKNIINNLIIMYLIYIKLFNSINILKIRPKYIQSIAFSMMILSDNKNTIYYKLPEYKTAIISNLKTYATNIFKIKDDNIIINLILDKQIHLVKSDNLLPKNNNYFIVEE